MFGVVVWGSVEAGVSGGPSPDVHQGSLDRATAEPGTDRGEGRQKMEALWQESAMCYVQCVVSTVLQTRGSRAWWFSGGQAECAWLPAKEPPPRARLGTATGTSHELKSESPTNSLCPAASARELD